MSSKNPTAAVPLAALWAAMALALPAAAAPPQQQQQQQEQQEQPGMVVARDPQTGQLRAPTAAELKALREQGEASMMGKAAAEGPTAVPRTDGVRQMRLGERGMVYSVVTRDADGKLVRKCMEGEHAVEAAVKSGAAAAKDKREHNHD